MKSNRKHIPSFTLNRGNYYRWYRGKSRYVGGAGMSRKELDRRWQEIVNGIDNAAPIPPDVERMTFRDALARFLRHARERVAAGELSYRSAYNYRMALNKFGSFIGASRPLKDLCPHDFGLYVEELKRTHKSADAFNSELSRVSVLFNWAVKAEYIPRFRHGVEWKRRSKQTVRDARIVRKRSFTVDEVAKLWTVAPLGIRCWIALGICCAFNNSDIGNLPRECVDLGRGVIDFRRRKTGKVKRVCPLPAEVVDLLKSYTAPAPAREEFAPLFFRTKRGIGFVSSSNRNGKPTDQVSRLFWHLVRDAGVIEHGTSDGRNFAGLRTTFRNLCPPGRQWAEERDIIMGHFDGTIDADNYVEEIGLDRLRHVVEHVWGQVASKLPRDQEGKLTAPAEARAASEPTPATS